MAPSAPWGRREWERKYYKSRPDASPFLILISLLHFARGRDDHWGRETPIALGKAKFI
jgi:hypothetical protein